MTMSMPHAFSAAMTGPGCLRAEPPRPLPRPEPMPPGGPGDWDEPPEGDAEAPAQRWPWSARLVGVLATAAAIGWGLLIAVTFGLLDWLA